jgi:hypothetical protein
MRNTWMVAVVPLVLIGAGLAEAQHEPFRIDTDVFSGDDPEPFAQSITIFSEGMVYDFPQMGPGEITVFDPARGRIILLDGQRRVKTTVSTHELLEFTAAMKVKLTQMGGVMADTTDNPVEKESGGDDQWYVLGNRLVTYRVRGIEPRFDEAAARYQQFADWYARLNATRPGSMPPFLRIELNRALVQHGLIPEEVELIVTPERGLMGRDTTIRSRHLPYWRLSNTDRQRIETAGHQMAKFTAVSFQEYRQAATP